MDLSDKGVKNHGSQVNFLKGLKTVSLVSVKEFLEKMMQAKNIY